MRQKVITGHVINSKVLPLKMDAEYYRERALQYMDRGQFEKAVKSYRRLVELEPLNPDYFCNLAAALAESGNFQESNETLSYVLSFLDSSLTECLFFMANNYANLDDWEQSERYLLKYMEEDEDGYYMDDCREMLEFFVEEIGRPPVQPNTVRSMAGHAEHDRARSLLESGRFQEAIQVLQAIIEQKPDFFPAKNNIALAYYYTGEFEKSMRAVYDVLEVEPNNLHALCNQAILLHHYGEQTELDLLLKRLGKLQPIYADHLFKLATTMGMLNRHETAYQLFRSIVKGNFESIEPDACFYHYAAVASFNVGNLVEARRWWEKATKIDPQSEVAKFFLSQMKEWLDRNSVPTRKLKYQYVLPFSEHLRTLHLHAKNQIDISTSDFHFMKSSFRWAMREDDAELKKLIIEGLALIRNDEMIRLLQDMCVDVTESPSVRAFLTESLQEYQLLPQPPWRNWPGIWGEVIETAFRKGSGRYESVMLRDMEVLWTDFFHRKHESTPDLTNLNAWSAALEYVTLKMHDHPCTYSQIAERYGISKGTITNRVQWIQETCEVSGKIHKLVEQMRELINLQEIKR